MSVTDDVERRPAPAVAAAARWASAWVTLCLALALHVADEALNGFLEVWNPLVREVRDVVPGLPLPVFRFEIWLSGLVAAVAVLLALSCRVRRGARWMIPLSFVFGLVMLGNGLLHIVVSLSLGRAVPGVWSAPVLIAASVFLLIATRRVR